MIPVNPDDCFCDLAEEGAALGLLGLMTGLSEELWCAAWMSDTEYRLWNVTPGTGWGMGEITDRQATLLRLLSEECDGWWFYEAGKGPKFIRREQWIERMNSLKGD